MLRKLLVPFLVLTCTLGGFVAGPTWLAHHLADGDDPARVIAPPVLDVPGLPLYFVTSVEQFGIPFASDPAAFVIAFAVTFGGPILGLGVATLSSLYGKPEMDELGRDRWMTYRQAKRAGLTAGRGVVVGQFGRGRRRKLLTFDGPEHQMVTGASRSGKGTGHVVPTLLTWHRSALVYDVKGELWAATAGWRSRFSHCVRFNPVDADSVRYNPLLEVRRGVGEIRDAQNIAEMLVDDGTGRPRAEPWDSETAQLLTGVILHVLYAEPDGRKNLGRVRDLLMDLDVSLNTMLATGHVAGDDGRAVCHPEVKAVARHLRSQTPKFRDSVRGTATARLTLWADPIVRQVTSDSDFSSGDLMCLKAPMTLYVQPPPADAARVRPLTRLLLNQLTRSLLEHLDRDVLDRPKRHRLLLLLDEFPTLRKMEFVSDGLRQMAGYGIKAMIVAQSFQDIEEYYGPKQTVIDNCHVLAAFATADTGTAQRISQMTGTVTEFRRSYGRKNALDPTRSINYGEHTRPLMSPGNVRELDYDRQLVFVTGHPPLRCEKVRYFSDPLFKKRMMKPQTQTRERIDLPARPTDVWRGVHPAGPAASEAEAGREDGFGTDDIPLDPAGELGAEPVGRASYNAVGPDDQPAYSEAQRARLAALEAQVQDEEGPPPSTDADAEGKADQGEEEWHHGTTGHQEGPLDSDDRDADLYDLY